MKGIACLVVLAMTLFAMVTAQAINPPGAPADHFLSYKTKTTKGTKKFASLPSVRLADEFEDASFDVKAVGDFLVPVGANGAAVVDAATHLRAYKIKAVKGSPKHVKRLRTAITNHLGTLLVDTVKPDLLLVPTAQDPGIAPPPPDPSSHGVDHYKCYLVRLSKGGAKLAKGLTMTVGDPFTQAAKVLSVRALKHLCLPVDKKLEGIKNRLGDLACYIVAPTKGQPKHVPRHAVHVDNQFGPLTLDTTKENELCVPAVASVPTPTPPATGGPSVTPGATSLRTATPTPVSTAGLPPDPATVASEIEGGVVSLPAFTTSFLFDGDDPIQTGVTENAIDERRVAVLRGRVLDRNGGPLAAVRVTILGHPELGQTLTRLDGIFDLAVNGGGMLTVDYDKAGFLPVQRQADVPWQEFVTLPDVMLTPLDAQMTAIDLDQGQMVVARGSVQSDADGTRQTTLLFPAGTTATMIDAQGQEHALSQLSVRATEYTVGPNGPAAMPGSLPPSSAYTYAVELSADEAIAAGAEQVTFSQPIFHYVENFLGFPVGTPVPTGFYDREQGLWVAAANGRVIGIVSIASGRANLDTDGDGVVDNGTALGVTDTERQQLAALYAAGQSLWRVPIPHFSTVDCNWPFVPPLDATTPNAPAAGTDDPLDECVDEQPVGSVIECQNQILGETVAVVGTPFTLNYRSDRVAGHQGARTVSLAASGASVPASLERIEVDMQIAGQTLRQTLPANANQNAEFTWDGRDVYGRTLQGRQPFRATIGYVYEAVYATPAEAQQAFGAFGAAPISGDRTREEITIGQVLTGALGTLDARGTGLGGWTLSVHHAYDAQGEVVYLGNGRRISAGAIRTGVTTLAGGGAINATTGIAAKSAKLLASPFSVVFTADGTLFFSIPNEHRIGRVGRDGVLALFGSGPGFGGDGQLLGFGQFSSPQGLAVGPDGVGYIADTGNNRIRRVEPSGTLSTIAGTGDDGFAGDDGPALDAALANPKYVAVGPDGSLFVADNGNERIRRIGTDGVINTIAGGGTTCCNQIDGINALDAELSNIGGLAVDAKGIVYFANGDTILRIGLDGLVTRIAGDFDTCDFAGDGGPARQAKLCTPTGLALDADGGVYVGDRSNERIRAVGADGIITSVAGGGADGTTDEVPALQARLEVAQGPAIAPDGSLHVVVRGPNRIRRFRSLLPSFAGASFSVASEDGAVLYQFDAAGRHLSTVNTLTGAAIYTFSYDGDGRLVAIQDGDGNVTTIERDSGGKPTAVVGPFGQRTALALDPNGFLASVTNPAGDIAAMTYTPGGLLSTFTNPRNDTSTYHYDDLGRLIRSDDPAGGSQTIARTELANGHEISRTTALGRTAKSRVENLTTGDQRLTSTAPDGTVTHVDLRGDGTRLSYFADGTTVTTVTGPDPRFGMQAPVLTRQTVTTPAGPSSTVEVARTATFSQPDDPLSLTRLTETLEVNGRPYVFDYEAATRTFVTTSPVGRQNTSVIDDLGRTLREGRAGLDPTFYGYDALGRLISATRGQGSETRSLSLTYDADDFLASISGGGRTIAYGYDAAGRVTARTLPGGGIMTYAYDRNGNLVSATPPGKPAHEFTYSAVNLPLSYEPPALGPGTVDTLFALNLDRQVTGISRPDATSVQVTYDAAGRRSTLGTPGNAFTYAYDATNGRLSSAAAPGGATVTFTYDGALLERTTWQGPVAGNVGFGHDSELRIASIDVNGSAPAIFQYDADQMLVNAAGLSLNRSAQHGLIAGTTLGSVSDTWGNGGLGELATYSVTVSGAPAYAWGLVRDAFGRVTQKSETIGGVTVVDTYFYDARGRLEEVRRNGATIATYAYDANGNRVGADLAGGPITASYDAQDRLLLYGDRGYTYSANGELASRSRSGLTTTYTYDARGSLLEVALPTGTTVEYVIDGLNRRVGKIRNGTPVQAFLYQDRLHPVAELDGSNAVVSRFVYASRSNTPDVMIRSGVTYRIVADHLGSPRLVIDSTTGAIVQRMDYDEFGNVLQDTNPGFQPFGFAGGLYDADTKLTRFGARDYDAEVGRWTAKDPLLFAGGDSNLYAYVQSSPQSLVDPTGLAHCTYDVANPKLTCTSVDGNSLTIEGKGVFSGGYSNEAGLDCTNNPSCFSNSDGGPIPPGEYSLVPVEKSGATWFFLDPGLISKALYSTGGPFRGGFNLHPGTQSAGCVTVSADARQETGGTSYEDIADLLLGDFLQGFESELTVIVGGGSGIAPPAGANGGGGRRF